MHKIARMDDTEYRPIRNKKKRMPIVSRGAVRDYEEAEDNGEEDPMIAEEIEPDKPEKNEKGKSRMHLRRLNTFLMGGKVLCNWFGWCSRLAIQMLWAQFWFPPARGVNVLLGNIFANVCSWLQCKMLGVN